MIRLVVVWIVTIAEGSPAAVTAAWAAPLVAALVATLGVLCLQAADVGHLAYALQHPVYLILAVFPSVVPGLLDRLVPAAAVGTPG